MTTPKIKAAREIMKESSTLYEVFDRLAWKPDKPANRKCSQQKTKLRQALAALLLFPLIASVQAGTITIENATIEKVSINNKWRGGGCLAFVSSYTGSKWCAANWVSFNCDEGKDSRPFVAKTFFDYALIAMERRSLINITVDESKIVNGHCSVDELVINKEKAE